ncbi:MAG: helix-turn-helix transcriptional regulator, partial [Clostridia bacterium]|nr:helix-turn-helix transcriptional regulator [Clostridia bacterium]
MDIGSRITQLRKAKGISTNKLSNLAGVSQSYLREVEMGKKNPTVET